MTLDPTPRYTWGWCGRGVDVSELRVDYRAGAGLVDLFAGVPAERADMVPFTGEPHPGGRIDPAYRFHVLEDSRRAQRDRSTALPRIILEHHLGRPPAAAELAVAAALCNRRPKRDEPKVYAVTVAELEAALADVSPGQLPLFA